MTGTANKTLGFVKRNIKTKLSGVKEAAFTTLVWPQMEYNATIWDPHYKDKTSQIEKAQWRAAHWTTCITDTRASVSDMIGTLGLELSSKVFASSLRSLTTWSQCSSLITSSQTPEHLGVVNLDILPIARGKGLLQVIFFPLAIVQWNALLEDVVSSQSHDMFKAAVGKLQRSKP